MGSNNLIQEVIHGWTNVWSNCQANKKVDQEMSRGIQEMWTEATGSMWPRPWKFTAGEYDIHLLKFAELIVGEMAQHLTNIGHDSSREAVVKHFQTLLD